MIVLTSHFSIHLINPGVAPSRDFHDHTAALDDEKSSFWEWVEENVGGEYQTWCGGLVVEPRYSSGVVSGLQADGFEVEIP